ncbi:MAG: hypothetical protein WCQ99_01510 [Pseudomonadota bacterium]
MVRLLSEKLVSLIQKNTDHIVELWTNRLKNDPTTPAFATCELLNFEAKAKMLLSNLGEWVGYDIDKVDVGRKYAQEGIGLFRMRIPLCEGINALIMLKRMLWTFVMAESSFDSVIEQHQIRELNERVTLFFDRAEYYFIRGYLEEMNLKMKELWLLSDEDTERIFFKNSFYNKRSYSHQEKKSEDFQGLFH